MESQQSSPTLFKVPRTINAFPASAKQNVDWLPCDIDAQALVDIITFVSSTKDKAYAVHYIVNPYPVPWGELVGMLKSVGMLEADAQEVPLDTWIHVYKAEILASTERDWVQASGLTGMFEKILVREWSDRPFATKNTQGASETFSLTEPYNEEWLRRYFQSWKKIGFL